MLSPKQITFIDRDATVLRRVRIFAVLELLLLITLIMLLLTRFSFSSAMLFFGFAAILMILAFTMLISKNTRILRTLVIANIIIGILIVVLLDPLDQSVSGASWPLFFIFPPAAMLILRDIRFFIGTALLTILCFIVVPLLEFNQVIAVEFLVPAEYLFFTWAVTLISLMMVFLLMGLIGRDEQQATQHLQSTLYDLDTSNQALQSSAAAIQATNDQLQTALQRQQQLQADVEQLGTPLIAVGNGVMLLPLLGTLDTQRLDHIQATIPATLHTSYAAHVVIDFTGSLLAEPQVVQTVEALIKTIKLLGIKVTITGVSAAMAQLLARSAHTDILQYSGRLEDVLERSFQALSI